MNRKIFLSEFAVKKMFILTKKYKEVENGGLLFGRMNPSWVQVLDISDAGTRAVRTKFKVIFDHDYLEKCIEEKLKNNLFVIGTWHSHLPFNDIEPSHIDKITMFRISKQFNSYSPVFCIIKYQQDNFLFNFFSIDKKKLVQKQEYIIINGGGFYFS